MLGERRTVLVTATVDVASMVYTHHASTQMSFQTVVQAVLTSRIGFRMMRAWHASCGMPSWRAAMIRCISLVEPMHDALCGLTSAGFKLQLSRSDHSQKWCGNSMQVVKFELLQQVE